jgi:HTH-type transcriptional regulator, sugar sensing transcriptional regulator
MDDENRDMASYLQDVGLSEYESSAYLSLLEHGVSTAKQVGSAADIPYSRVYDVLESLQSAGLVKVQPGRPKKYGPVPPETALDNVKQRKQAELESELASIEKAGDLFLDAYNDDTGGYPIYDEIDIFWSYVGKSDILNRGGEMTENADDRVYKITTENSLRRIVTQHNDILRRKSEEGISIKIISTVSDLPDAYIEDISEWGELRHLSDIGGRLYTYDDDRLVLAFKNDSRERYVAISIENQQMVQTAYLIFDRLWDVAEPVSM